MAAIKCVTRVPYKKSTNVIILKTEAVSTELLVNYLTKKITANQLAWLSAEHWKRFIDHSTDSNSYTKSNQYGK